MREFTPYNFKCPTCGRPLKRNPEGLFACSLCKQVYEVGENFAVAKESRFFRNAVRKIAPEVYAVPFGYTVPTLKNKNRIFAALQKLGTIERHEDNRAAYIRVPVDKGADFAVRLQERRVAFDAYGNRLKHAQVEMPALGGKLNCAEAFAAFVQGIADDCAMLPVENDADKLYYRGKALYEDKNYDRAVPELRPAAEQGHVGAQYMMGLCCENGRGTPQNAAEAVSWYKAAAAQRDCDAQRRLGVCYEDGIGVERDSAASAQWYRMAAEEGDPDAQCLLGVCYQLGQGVERNNGLAAKWVRQSAAQGCAAGQACLGVFFEYGISPMPTDYAEAVKWYRRAAAQGNADAKRRLTALEQKIRAQTKNPPPEIRAGAYSTLYVNNSPFGGNSYGKNKKTNEKQPVNWLVFVVLLFLFWPGAIIYLLAAKKSRAATAVVLSIFGFIIMLVMCAVNMRSCIAALLPLFLLL